MNRKQTAFIILILILSFLAGIIILFKAKGSEAFNLGLVLMLPLIAAIAFKLFIRDEEE